MWCPRPITCALSTALPAQRWTGTRRQRTEGAEAVRIGQGFRYTSERQRLSATAAPSAAWGEIGHVRRFGHLGRANHLPRMALGRMTWISDVSDVPRARVSYFGDPNSPYRRFEATPPARHPSKTGISPTTRAGTAGRCSREAASWLGEPVEAGRTGADRRGPHFIPARHTGHPMLRLRPAAPRLLFSFPFRTARGAHPPSPFSARPRGSPPTLPRLEQG